MFLFFIYFSMRVKKIRFFVIILIIILIMAILLVNLIDKRINPVIMDYSVIEMKRVATVIINRSITAEVLDNKLMEDLFIVSKDDSEIMTITLDNRIINQITTRISDACEDNLRKVEEGKFKEIKRDFNIGEEYFLVPTGIIFKNALLSNLGPKVPINLKMIGNVTSSIKTDVKEYGINNSLITVSVEIKVELMVILPLSSDYVSITNFVPIAVKMIQGKVPHIYGGDLLN